MTQQFYSWVHLYLKESIPEDHKGACHTVYENSHMHTKQHTFYKNTFLKRHIQHIRIIITGGGEKKKVTEMEIQVKK